MKSQLIAAGLLGVTTLGITLYPHAYDYVNAAPIVKPSNHSVVVPTIDPANHVITDKPIIDVVFALDTTGSMGGMIQTAKEKIWSIASTMANAQTAPQIRIGLVAYRDRGDAYVTRRIDLSDDLDSVFANLMQFQAGGGGDTPESVNQALHEAVTKMSWSENQNAYKVVFLVGDAPAHKDYKDDVQYDITAKLAKEKGILLNAIQCGTSKNAETEWQTIAQLGGGRYFQVDQEGGALAIVTPYDDELATLSRQLDETRLFYGDEKKMVLSKQKEAATDQLHTHASVASRARRAEFNASESGAKNLLGDNDLVQDYVAGDVAIEEISKEHLPTTLQAMPAKEREVTVKKMAEDRTQIQNSIRQLVKKRQAFIKNETNKRKDVGSSLDSRLFATIKEQTASKGLKYSDDAVRF